MYLQKSIHFIFIILSFNFSFSQSYDEWRNEAYNYINENDAAKAINSLTKIITSYNKSPDAVLDIYLLRAKLNTISGNYEQANNDLDTYFLYDSACAEAYISKLILIDNQQKKLACLNAGLQKLPNDIQLQTQRCIVKIGLVTSYWEMQNNIYGNGFHPKQAAKEIPYAQNACTELLQLSDNNAELQSLYKKLCKIDDIKKF